jgi:o-succinylbenzoate---CoA ligase
MFAGVLTREGYGRIGPALRSCAMARHPHAIDPADVAAVQAALERSLAGAGPAVLPIPPTGLPAGLADDGAVRPDESTAVVIVTSGSTGEPKAVELSAAAVRAGAEATHSRLGGPGQWLLSLPVSGVAGLQVLTRSLLSGIAPVIVAPSLRGSAFADGVAAMTGNRRYAALVPTQLHRLLGDQVSKEALADLDGVLIGGAAAGPDLLEPARAAGVRVVTTYGMTETCGGCVYDGLSLDGMGVALGADARIRLAGPMLFTGYLGQPDLTAEVLRGGWFTTSDLGELDADGLLRVLGRTDDVVVVGGTNVSLPGVADRLRAHDLVVDAYCVGVPDAEWGTVVGAAVVGDSVPPTTDLQDWVRAVFPGTAVPRRVVRVAGLPMLPNGKTDRAAVEREFTGGSL